MGYAVFQFPSSSPVTLGSGGNIRGRSTIVLPISYICSHQSAHRLEAYPRCLGPERVHRDSVVKDVQSCLPETGAVAISMVASLDLKDAYLYVLIRNKEPSLKEPSQVSSSIVLGQAVFLQGSPVRVSVALHHT